ncbi:hypothetical protein K490DRAFT_63923 [Saccharata proteae CBS 121410]|uniref:Ankyrin n=1 Tax=Saccharata proteae CBS 121410 TaxID=1314787 RepID=A0A6A5YAQ7_9PEZI|nr:hypothetical protein K490DRAFT_63923 [Saccharata proteae CBS 121410]
MHLRILDFPGDIFRLIMEQCIFTLGIRHAMRARLVCKAFNTWLTDAAFTTRAFEVEMRTTERLKPKRLSRPDTKWIARMLRERATADNRDHCELLIFIRVAVELILDFRGDEHGLGREECLEAVCMFYAEELGNLAADVIDPAQVPQRSIPLTTAEALHSCLGPAASMGDTYIVGVCLRMIPGPAPALTALKLAIKAAARGGYIETLQQLWTPLQYYPQYMDDVWQGAFCAACHGGHEHLCHELLARNQIDVKEMRRVYNSSFVEASAGNRVKIMHLILEKLPPGTGLANYDGYKQPMHQACAHGAIDAVQLMLSLGANVIANHVEVAASHGHAATCTLLLRACSLMGRDFYSKMLWQAFLVAGVRGYARISNSLANVLVQTAECGSFMEGCILRFTTYDQADSIRLLYWINRRLYPAPSEYAFGYHDAKYALDKAMSRGFGSVVRAILELEESMNVRGDGGKELMRSALASGNPYIVEILADMRGEKADAVALLKSYWYTARPSRMFPTRPEISDLVENFDDHRSYRLE